MASPASPILDGLEVPIVLAPLAGGPSTAALAAAVCEAGGLGSLGAGYLRVEQMQDLIARTRSLTSRPFAVNLFVPGAASHDSPALREWIDRLRRREPGLGKPRSSDEDWEAKLDALSESPPAVVSFTFGPPGPEVIRRLRRAGAECWVTVTDGAEAAEAEVSGADVLVIQGSEAGGHRGGFTDHPGLAPTALLPLLALVRRKVQRPLVATGGIADGASIAGVLAAGASAAQLGTAFLLCPEAGTSAPHREALCAGGETVLTRAFTGRLARGLRNRFHDDYGADAPVAYPEVHYVTAPLRAAAREAGDAGSLNLWAGEGVGLITEQPAGELTSRLAREAADALQAAARRWPAATAEPTATTEG